MAVASLNLGRVRGEDGFSPEVTVKEDTPGPYILHVKDKAHEFDTPNLRGATFKPVTVEVEGHEPTIVPFSDLGLNPDMDYFFYAIFDDVLYKR